MDWLSGAIGCLLGMGGMYVWARLRRSNEQQAYHDLLANVWPQAQQWGELCTLLRQRGWRVISPSLIVALLEPLHTWTDENL